MIFVKVATVGLCTLIILQVMLHRQGPTTEKPLSSEPITVLRGDFDVSPRHSTPPTTPLPLSGQGHYGAIPVENQGNLLEGILPKKAVSDFPNDPSLLHRNFRAQQRDLNWAPQAEKTLKLYSVKTPYLDKSIETRVICATTICEFAGVIDSTASISNMNVALSYLQSAESIRFAETNGFDPHGYSVAFGSSPSRPSSVTFVRYFVKK